MAEPRLKPGVSWQEPVLPSSRTSRDEATERPGRWQEQWFPIYLGAQRGHQFDLGWSEKTLLGRGYLICPRMGARIQTGWEDSRAFSQQGRFQKHSRQKLFLWHWSSWARLIKVEIKQKRSTEGQFCHSSVTKNGPYLVWRSFMLLQDLPGSTWWLHEALLGKSEQCRTTQPVIWTGVTFQG